MVRFRSVPSFSVNFRSFLDFGTASQASTLTTLKSDLLNVSKSTSSANRGSIFTIEKSIRSGSAFGASAAWLFTSFLPLTSFRGFMVGNRITSRMESLPVRSMTHRSMPMPRPPVGGRPYSKAVRKSSSIISVSSFPLARSSTCFWKRWRWSMGSLSSEKALPISLRQMNSSKRSVSRGSLGLRLARGETSTGCMVMKVGWTMCSSTFWS